MNSIAEIKAACVPDISVLTFGEAAHHALKARKILRQSAFCHRYENELAVLRQKDFTPFKGMKVASELELQAKFLAMVDTASTSFLQQQKSDFIANKLMTARGPNIILVYNENADTTRKNLENLKFGDALARLKAAQIYNYIP